MPEQLLELAVDQLMPDPTQPRKNFHQEELERLAASIKARGVLQPLRVVFDHERQCWLIVTGESRWRAARLAHLDTLPCLAIDGRPEEADLLADRIVENHCRSDLSEIDLAHALHKLRALRKCTGQALAAELGISAAAITRTEALLSLPEDIQQLVATGQLPGSTAYEISRLPDAEAQRELAQAAASRRLNRADIAGRVQARIGKKQVKPRASRLACRFEGGIGITVSGGEALDWESLLAALDRLRRTAKRLRENGEDITALSRALNPSAS
ncbi:ParB/RepB/Spo0J family partition protein [Tautonia marina]|uniref:ParB/RepB/Spo0J family partition protein n=1 Tax=Tautonia marina TaxID=2653855 RepID=UPI0012606587|nr:ParB/RepB/Spo0J family partition protein [Tautonia marina]